MGGSRPGTAGGLGKSSVTHSDGALVALSRQLVQAKMAEADAQRKHRCTLLATTCSRGVPAVSCAAKLTYTAQISLMEMHLANKQPSGRTKHRHASL